MPATSTRVLQLIDDVRPYPRGPLIGRVFYHPDPENVYFLAVPFSEIQPAIFATRADAQEHVERRGRPPACRSCTDEEAAANRQSV